MTDDSNLMALCARHAKDEEGNIGYTHLRITRTAVKRDETLKKND